MFELIEMLWVVANAMFGGWLWLLLAVALATVAGLVVTVRRERGISAPRLRWAEAAGLVGGFAMAWLMLVVTKSGLHDLKGLVDWVLLGGYFALGFVVTAIVVYAALGVLGVAPRRRGAYAATIAIGGKTAAPAAE